MKVSDAMQDVLDSMWTDGMHPHQIQQHMMTSKNLYMATKVISQQLQRLKKAELVTHSKMFGAQCGYRWTKTKQHPCSGKCPRFDKEQCGTCLVGEGA